MKIVTADQMRKIDAVTIDELGVPSLVLMERAGAAVANRIEEIYDMKSVVILSGGGNNGGDGLVIARILKNRGWDVKVLLLIQEDRLSPDCLSQYRIAVDMKVNVEFRKRLTEADTRNSIIVDAILGTGINKPVEGHLLNAITAINRSGSPVVSVDIPSGISSDTGQIMGEAIKADYTVTFGLPKIGHFIYPGADYTGKLFVEDIGFPDFLTSDEELKYNLTEIDFVRNLIQKRRPEAHKGTFGHVFVIAGSRGKTGAAMLAARACMRTGAGAVTIGVPESIINIFQVRVYEEMTFALPSNDEGTVSHKALRKALDFINKHAHVVVVGPGLGVNEDVTRFVCDVISNSNKPLLLDADGLNCISGKTGILKDAKVEIVITPHPNEMRRLLIESSSHITAEDINKRRIDFPETFSVEKGVICVLKGVPTVVASPDGSVYINTTGNPGMATAGSGDVLSGIVASLMAQGHSALQSAVSGVYIHGLSGDIARDNVGEYSLVAGDLVQYVPEAFRKIRPHEIVS